MTDTVYTTPALVAEYATKLGLSWPADAGERTAAIARVTQYLNSLQWSGRKTDGRDQSSAWPRVGVVDSDGYEVESDEVPLEVEQAAEILAVVEAAEAGILAPVYRPADVVTMEKIGPLSFQYKPASGPAASRPVVLSAEALLAPFLRKRNWFLTRA